MEEEIDIERHRQEDYLSKEITLLINDLTEDTVPKWGIMTPQHMLEHLTGSFIISNGKIELTETKYDEEKLKKRKKFLLSVDKFAKNIGSEKEATLPALRQASFDLAKVEFFKQLIEFFGHHDKNKDANYLHPAFGPMVYREWLQFHYKHVQHHFEQFGLVSNS